MHLLPNTKRDPRQDASEGWLESAKPEDTNTATDSDSIKGLARRAFINGAVTLKNWFRRSKVHYYHISDRGSYFFLEESPDFADEVYITSYQSLVEPADFIKIQYVSATTTYRIVELQTYSNSPEIWIARLKALPSDGEPGTL